MFLLPVTAKPRLILPRINDMRFAITLILTLFAVGCSVDAQSVTTSSPPVSASKLKLTYVGNEGVLISDGSRSVLIDGLHREYGPEYLFPPTDVLNAIETAKPPFDTVRVVLVSHVHLDHFHAESVGLHLKNNPKASLVSSSQTMIDIARNYKDHETIRTQTREITPEWKERVVYEKDGIKITLLGLRHGGDGHWWVKNLGHIIEIGGKKLFHFGDADTAAENFASFELPAEKIDIAFIPYWFLLSENGRKVVRENIAARKNIAFHIPPATADKDAENVKTLFPGVEAFTRMKQEIDH